MTHFFFWIFAIIIIFIFISGIKMVKEYERVVVFRLGRFNGLKGPGLFWIIPWVDRVRLIDLRTQVVDVPRQEAITKDNIPVIVNAAIFYSVNDPAKAVIRVQNYQYAISQIAQTTLRSVIGGGNLDELVSNRDQINAQILRLLDEASDSWGVDCSRVELKDLELPENMKRAMAKQAESERERRSRIILAEGELQASAKLAEASRIMGESGGIYLRLLQTIQEISTENSSTVILPFPANLTGPIAKFLGTDPMISAGDGVERIKEAVTKAQPAQADRSEQEPAK